jgi:hypothetical protein
VDAVKLKTEFKDLLVKLKQGIRHDFIIRGQKYKFKGVEMRSQVSNALKRNSAEPDCSKAFE